MEIEESGNAREVLLQKNKTRRMQSNPCLFCCSHYKSYEQFATTVQFEQLSGLIAESKLRADPDSTYTKDSLLTLYKNAFPTLPTPPLTGKEWKTLGFQSENPLTDLRSSGKLSLENILYFSEHHQPLYAKMVQETTDYPFIASAINITTLLLIHLHISVQYTFCPCCGTSFKQAKKVPLKEMVMFANLLEDCSWETVFNELFSLGVMLMVSNYKRRAATDPTFTILDFRKVFVDTREQIMDILRQRPETITDIFDLAKPYLEK